MKVEVKKLLPNPYRDMDSYPIDRKRVEALKKSIKKTEFWDNLVGRRNGDGGVEIAYGHHRLIALKEAKVKTVDISVRKLSDEAMIRMMADENMGEWGHDFTVEMETVRAVVKAYGAGKIELKKPKATANRMRHAPSTIQGSEGLLTETDLPYTAATISGFLGWFERRVAYCLQALELIESGVLSQSDFVGLGNAQAQAVLRETAQEQKKLRALEKTHEEMAKRSRGKRAKEKHKQKAADVRKSKSASTVGKAVSKKIRDGKVGFRKARDVAEKVGVVLPKAPHDLSKYVEVTIRKISNTFDTDELANRVSRIATYSEYLSPTERRRLERTLENLAARATAAAAKFEPTLKVIDIGKRK